MMEEAAVSKILDLNKSETMKDILCTLPMCQFSWLTCAKGFQLGHNRKHKHFCVVNHFLLAEKCT